MIRRLPWYCLVFLFCIALLLTACQILVPVSHEDPVDLPTLTNPQTMPTIPPLVEAPTPMATLTPAGPLAVPRPTREVFGPRYDWANYANLNEVHQLAAHTDGSLWAATAGGVVRWDLNLDTARPFGSADGLASQAITALWITQDGMVWAGTDAGLSRYDGKGWVTFTDEDGLPGSLVYSLVETADGTLWCGTDQGLGRYDGETWEIAWEASSETAQAAIGLGLQTHDGSLWFAVQGDGLLHYDGETWHHQNAAEGAPAEITVMLEDTAGALWVGTMESGLWRYAEGVWTHYTTANGLPDNQIFSLVQGLSDTLWVGTALGIVQFDGTSWTAHARADGMPETPILDMVLGFDGHIWCATHEGILRYDETGQVMGFEADPPAVSAHTLLVDQARGLFVGTSSGLARYANDIWITYQRQEWLPTNDIVDIIETDGSLWLATADAGVMRFDGSTWQAIAPWTRGTERDATPFVSRLFDADDGTLWLTGLHNVAQIDPVTGETLYRSRCLPDGLQMPLTVTGDKTVWFAHVGGLSAYRPNDSWEEIELPEMAASALPLSMLELSDGTLLIGTDSAGLLQRTAAGEPIIPMAGLRSSTVRTLVQGPDDFVWAATADGLGRFDGQSWTLLTTTDGLADNDVRTLWVEPSGELWIGTALTLVQYDGENWQVHSQEDGLPEGEIETLVQATDGALWAGTSQGIARFEDDTWTTIIQTPGLSSLVAEDGSLWFGTDRGILRYDGLGGYELDGGNLTDTAIRTLLQSDTDVLWAQVDQGVALYSDGDWTSPSSCGPSDGVTLSMLRDRQGDLWILTSEGLSRHREGTWQHYGQADGLPDAPPLKLVEDGQGQLWYVAMHSLMRYTEDDRWTETVIDDELDQLTLYDLVVTDDGDRWLATDAGLYHQQGAIWQPIELEDERTVVSELAISTDGVLWASGETGLFRYESGTWQVFERGGTLPDTAITTLLPFSDGTMWVGTEGHGVWHHNARGWNTITSLHGLAQNDIYQLYEASDGALWIVTANGISRYSPAP